MRLAKSALNIALGLVIYYQACFGLGVDWKLNSIHSFTDVVDTIERMFITGHDQDFSGANDDLEFPADESEETEEKTEEKENKDDKEFGQFLNSPQPEATELFKDPSIHNHEANTSIFLKVLVPPPDQIS